MAREPLAAALGALGVRPGHRLGVLGAQDLHVAAHRAAARLDAALVPLPWETRPDRLADITARMGVEAWVTDAAGQALVAAAGDALPRVVVDGGLRGEGGPLPRPRHRGGTAAVLLTSGTTGRPKIVTISRTALAAHAKAASHRLRSTRRSVWLAALPLHHIGGVALLDRCLRTGARIVPLERFGPEAAMDVMEREGVTHVSLVPTMLHRLVGTKRGPPASLECALVGGDRLDPALLDAALAAGWPAWPTYGLTEACSQVATATPAEARDHRGTVGRPLEGVTVRIVGPDGSPRGADEEGEVEVAGTTVIGSPLRTGDTGYLDEAGRLYVTGRVSERIVSGGENVDAVEVEAVLRRHPAVLDACVVGVPDPEWGEQVAAAVVRRGEASVDAMALASWCTHEMAAHQRPRRFLFLAEVPRTENGKPRRGDVRQRVLQETVPT